MSLLAVASAKGQPGVSTFVEILAQLLPARVVVADCDPAGSDWLVRPGVLAEPGLVELASAGRRDLRSELIADHVQRIGELDVLVGPAAARQAHAALQALGERLGPGLHQLAAPDGLAVVDCGRLSPESPVLVVLRAADLVVLVTRPTVGDLVHLAPWVDQLRDLSVDVAVVVVAAPSQRRGEVVYPPAEVAEGLGVDVLGVVSHDPMAAGRLYAQPGSLRGLERSALVASVHPLAAELTRRLSAQQPSPSEVTGWGGRPPSLAEQGPGRR